LQRAINTAAMSASPSQDYRDLARELERRVEGDVRFDRYTRLLYATDASMYEIEPIGVVLPRSKNDVQAAVQVGAQWEVPILPRGGGTSLAGQTVGRAVVLDFSKYMNRVLDMDGEGRWCRVQPGLVQDELNLRVRPMGLLFGPDTSTSNRATLGGMIGNNSAGIHSIAYGKTVDHVLELTAILSDGSEVVMGDLGPGDLAQKCRQQDLEGALYREVSNVAAEHREEILGRYPKILRRVSGYNLDEFVKPQPFNLSRLVVGSEGTLASVVEARVRLVPSPRFVALDVIHFRQVQDALEASPLIVETGPYAVELLERQILNLARNNLLQSKRLGFIQGDPGAILIVEVAGDTEGEVRDKIQKLEAMRVRAAIGTDAVQAFQPEEVRRIWAVRKEGLGLLLGMKGDKKPIAFVEDTAVSPEKLPAFIQGFREIVKRHGVEAGYYGHCSVGCLHIRPFINLRESGGIAAMTGIANEIADLVLACGGALSGEHGDGLARSHFNEKLFGRAIYGAFRRIKEAFDAKGIMNPGKIVDAPPMTESLRINPSYGTWEPQTTLDFSSQGGFAAAVEMCNGTGACRKTIGGTMCPSYMATRDEEHSTRGRANALRAVLSGKLPREEFTGRGLYDILDLCLECKACRAECPSNVDMAKLKYEVLSAYHRAHGLPLRNRLFGRIDRINRWGSRLAPFSNWVLRRRANRYLLDALAGIDRRRPLPAFAAESFAAWFRNRSPRAGGSAGQVVLLADTFNNFNTPHVAMDATRFLERLGLQVIVPQSLCCGRPLISKGMLGEARSRAAGNLKTLAPFARQGVPILGLEPSCLLTLRDEYPDLIPGEEATVVARQSLLLEEYLMRQREAGKLKLTLRQGAGKVLFQGHCHHKALADTEATVATLRWAGYDVEEVDAGCCGMAGAFGYEKGHYDLSVAIGNQRLAPAVRGAGAAVEIAADGISCRQQIRHLTGREARHPVELLWRSLASP